MVSGFDRYFQIAPCFRDEDAARRPLARRILPARPRDELRDPGRRVRRHGAGHARRVRGVRRRQAGDARTRSRASPIARRSPSTAPTSRTCATRSRCRTSPSTSAAAASASSRASWRSRRTAIWAIPAPGGGSRAFCDRMNAWAKGEGQPGLATSSGAKARRAAQGRSRATSGPSGPRRPRQQLGLKVGDAAFFVAGDPKAFYKFAGLARTKVGTELELIDEDQFEFCWIVDFPMFEFNEEDNHVDFSHNPFSMPQGEMEALEGQGPARDPGLPVRHRLQRRGAVLRRGAEPPARDHGQGVRDRRLLRERGRDRSSAAC